MGWFFSSESSDDDKATDPVSKLEPSLREYLQSQYTKSTTNTTPPLAPQSTPPSTQESTTQPQGQPAYGNRYAHLWKTYQPNAGEGAKSQQEQLADVLQAHRTRKAAIGQAALENCAEVQWELNECYRNGGLWGRLTSCSRQVKKMDECYSTQLSFLQVLGYMSDFTRPAEVDEKIQMHADKLYQEQLAEDKILEEAYRKRWAGENSEKMEVDAEGELKSGMMKGGAGLGRTRVGDVELVVEPVSTKGEEK